MVLGTLTITLQVPDSRSLKDKRQVVKSLVSRIRRTYNVAVAEVGDLDRRQLATLGLATVSTDPRHADEMCQKILRFVEEEAEALVTGSHFELVHL